jgi:hypothetical protein
MSKSQHIDHILKSWPYEPNGLGVRIVDAKGREVIQMRLDMGLLQMECEGRPDGARPHGFPTYFEYLRNLVKGERQGFQLDESQCLQVDREFVQYYHRRICWLQLGNFERAVHDADHTLRLMDLCLAHSPSDAWTASHEQYRPFVMYHRTQAAALDHLQRDGQAELAIEEINRGLEGLKGVFAKHELDEQFDDDELVRRLVEFQETLRTRYDIKRTLHEQLYDAIASEQYELAAQIRDRIANRKTL